MPIPILYVHSSASLYGSDKSLLHLVSHLDRERFLPVVVVPEDGPLVTSLKSLKVPVYTRPLCILHRTLHPDYWFRLMARLLPSHKFLRDLIRKWDIQLLHSNSSHVFDGALAARAASIPHVWHVREIHTGTSKFGFLLSKFIYDYSDAVITISKSVCTAFFGQCSANKLHVIYNGVDIQRFSPSISGDLFRAELGIGHNIPLVGIVGRIAHWKGHSVFIRAAAVVHREFPEARFLIVGDGVVPADYRIKRNLKRLVSKLGLEEVVIFVGTRTDIPSVMASLNVLVLASTKPEPLGRVILEAMSAGRPVVATNQGGPTEVMIDGETGYLVQPGDYDGTADAIMKLLRNPTLSLKMGLAGRSRCERYYTNEKTASEIVSVYETLMLR